MGDERMTEQAHLSQPEELTNAEGFNSQGRRRRRVRGGMVRAVVFDLDGTLIHFDIDYTALKEEVLRALGRLGIPTSSLSPEDTLTTILDKVECYIRASGLGNEFKKEVWAEVFRTAERFEAASVNSAKPMPGATDVLAALKERGLKIGLLTHNSSVIAVNVLERFGLKRFFDAMLARDFVEDVKPNPDHLSGVLRELGVKPDETVVVGDTVFDIRCAKELGAIAVGITTGRSLKEELEAAGADFIINSLSELLPLISRLGRSGEQ